MFRGNMNFLGSAIPTWLVAAALLAATAGAAVGIVLAGGVTGQIITTVDQGLLIDAVSGGGFNGVSDDKTSFTSAKETFTGDKYDIQLELQNRSQDQMAVSLTLDIPLGITVAIANPQTSLTQGLEVAAADTPTTLSLATTPIVDRNGDGDVTVADFDCTAVQPPTPATGTLTFAATVADGETVTIGATVYTFKTTLTATTFQVLIGASFTASRDNLVAAINAAAGAGTTYSTGTTLHPTVSAAASGADKLVATAKTAGSGGNSIVTLETLLGTGNVWGGATLTGGVTPICTKNSVVDARAGQVSVTVNLVNTGNDVTIGYSTGSNVTQLVRTGIGTWLFKLSRDSGDGGKDLKVTIAHADDSPPGFYTISGELRQTSLKP